MSRQMALGLGFVQTTIVLFNIWVGQWVGALFAIALLVGGAWALWRGRDGRMS